MTAIAHAALILTGTAAFFAVLAWLILSKTPAAETVPPVDAAAAVENPVEAGEGTPPLSPASGATDFDTHVEQALAIANPPRNLVVWCACCAQLVWVSGAPEVFAHLRSHAEDPAEAQHFEAWEREVSS